MEQTYCLNCSEETNKKFCANCGQKTDTHRITMKHFVFHDLLHGVWHLERGILFTLKETFVRPGQAALDYIGGKRVRYYNVFYLSLLAIGANVLLAHFFDKFQPLSETYTKSEINILMGNYLKFFIFCTLPFLAFNAMIIFRRLKLNFAEHLILAGMALLGMILLNLFYLSFDFVSSQTQLLVFIEVGFFIALLLFPSWVYFNATRKQYTVLGFLWRMIAMNLLFIVQLLIVLTSIAMLVQNNTEIGVDI